jgi:ketosteroid isomerase-like protein
MTGNPDKAAIEKMIKEWTHAIGAKDADAIAKFFTKDVVSFDLAPPLKNVGFDRKMMEDWFKTWQSSIGYEVTDQVIEVGDTIAVARSLDHMTGIKTGGEKVDVWTRSTVCFRKEGQDWKVMHVHSSVPFHMDGSFKAAVDLQP